MQKFPGALFWSRMAGRITNFSFRAGFFHEIASSVAISPAGGVPASMKNGTLGAAATKKHRVPGLAPGLGALQARFPQPHLPLGGAPYRILAGMAPGHNWGGA